MEKKYWAGREISVIGFGGAAVSGEGGGYGFGDITEDQSVTLLRQAKDRGINLFDTAPVYGFGLSEIRIGKAFKKNREDVVIVSKCGVSWNEKKRIFMSNEPKLARSMLEGSLRHLDSEYIDIYMVHWPDSQIDIRKTLEVLVKAKEEGKIRTIGLSNTNHSELNKALEVAPIEVVQAELSILKTDNLELLSFLDERQIAFMSWGTFAKGILTGRVKEGRHFDENDARRSAPWWTQVDHGPAIRKAEKLIQIAADHSITAQSLAVGWVLAQKAVKCALVGPRSLEQLESLINVQPVPEEIWGTNEFETFQPKESSR